MTDASEFRVRIMDDGGEVVDRSFGTDGLVCVRSVAQFPRPRFIGMLFGTALVTVVGLYYALGSFLYPPIWGVIALFLTYASVRPTGYDLIELDVADLTEDPEARGLKNAGVALGTRSGFWSIEYVDQGGLVEALESAGVDYRRYRGSFANPYWHTEYEYVFVRSAIGSVERESGGAKPVRTYFLGGAAVAAAVLFVLTGNLVATAVVAVAFGGAGAFARSYDLPDVVRVQAAAETDGSPFDARMSEPVMPDQFPLPAGDADTLVHDLREGTVSMLDSERDLPTPEPDRDAEAEADETDEEAEEPDEEPEPVETLADRAPTREAGPATTDDAGASAGEEADPDRAATGPSGGSTAAGESAGATSPDAGPATEDEPAEAAGTAGAGDETPVDSWLPADGPETGSGDPADADPATTAGAGGDSEETTTEADTDTAEAGETPGEAEPANESATEPVEAAESGAETGSPTEPSGATGSGPTGTAGSGSAGPDGVDRADAVAESADGTQSDARTGSRDGGQTGASGGPVDARSGPETATGDAGGAAGDDATAGTGRSGGTSEGDSPGTPRSGEAGETVDTDADAGSDGDETATRDGTTASAESTGEGGTTAGSGDDDGAIDWPTGWDDAAEVAARLPEMLSRAETASPPERERATALAEEAAEQYPGAVADSLDAVLARLDDDDPRVRVNAIRTVGHLLSAGRVEGVESGVGSLVACLDADDEAVREAAVAVVRRLAVKLPDPFEPYLERLLVYDGNLEGIVLDSNGFAAVREAHPERTTGALVESLDQLTAGGGDTGPLLDGLLSADPEAALSLAGRRIKSSDPSAIHEALALLTMLAPSYPETVADRFPQLRSLADDMPPEWGPAVTGLVIATAGLLEAESPVDAGEVQALLQRAFENPNPVVRQAGCLLLTRVAANTPEMVENEDEALAHCLDDDAAAVRRIACRAVGRLEASELCDRVGELQSDPDPTVRVAAERAVAAACRGRSG